jgi:hypothetical protein
VSGCREPGTHIVRIPGVRGQQKEEREGRMTRGLVLERQDGGTKETSQVH